VDIISIADVLTEVCSCSEKKTLDVRIVTFEVGHVEVSTQDQLIEHSKVGRCASTMYLVCVCQLVNQRL
jgi:hypothetical protein